MTRTLAETFNGKTITTNNLTTQQSSKTNRTNYRDACRPQSDPHTYQKVKEQIKSSNSVKSSTKSSQWLLIT